LEGAFVIIQASPEFVEIHIGIGTGEGERAPPGNVAEGGLLRPSLSWCRRHLGWWPGIVVADMGYLSAPDKQAVRTGWQCAVVTKLRADMKLVPPYGNAAQVECPQGQRLEWWEYDPANGQQWFRVPAEPELCAHCWEAFSCPRHFGYAVGLHETLLGLLPLASRVAQRLLRQVRPWIEPAQSFEKNQLGLGQMFFNSLRLADEFMDGQRGVAAHDGLAGYAAGSLIAGQFATASVGIGTTR
jgi:hypothetical protein